MYMKEGTNVRMRRTSKVEGGEGVVVQEIRRYVQNTDEEGCLYTIAWRLGSGQREVGEVIDELQLARGLVLRPLQLPV